MSSVRRILTGALYNGFIHSLVKLSEAIVCNPFDRARKELAGIFSAIIRARKASGKSEPDMLQAFMDSKYRSLGRSTTEEECTGLLIAALFAGQHTSSITSTWTGAYLMG